MGNVQSLRNKVDELQGNVRFQKDFMDCCIMAFTETWLTERDQDIDLLIDGFGAPFRLDRKAEVTGKTQGGGVCLYVNKRYCSSVTVRDQICTPDVELLSVSLRPFYLPHPHDSSADGLVAHYNATLSGSLDSLAPLKTRTVSYTRPAPWFTTELRTQKSTGRQLERRYKRSGLTVHLEAYKEHVRAYKVALSQAKTQYYSTLITNQQNHPRLLFSTINRLLRPLDPPLPSGAPDLCTKFLDFFQDKVESIHQQLLVAKLVTKAKASTCSLDPMPTALVKACLPALCPIMVNIINSSLASGLVPDSLKMASVTPILKKPGLDRDDSNNYRPISNLPFLSKILERAAFCCKCYLSISDHLCMELKSFLNRSDDFCNESANISGMTAVTTSYLLCIFVGCLSVLIMCGNLLVIISIIYFQQLHTPTNYLILSLALADLLVGVLVLPFSVILAVCSCCFLDSLCKVRSTFDMLLCASSILNLCCISVDRYYAVCQPLRYRSKINVRTIVNMILVSWTVSALIGIGNTIWGLSKGQSNICLLFQDKSKPTAIMGAIFTFYLPAIVMFSIYLKIFMVAQRQARSIQNTTCQNKKSGTTISKMERKATKTLAIVMGIFLICWTPFFLCISFHLFNNNAIPPPVIQMFKWLGWSNSMLNPFVYGFFYTWFRTAFRMIITGKIFQGNFTNYKLF
ncbi:uncharacterized protein LOC141756597 [Sebastes fasciatus]|uniref:uncharacterized protein LOC141756597 n=1 Tax=Sebastes fasciatus TaxID=394691 RepID=UPI003D9E424E